MLKFFGHTFMLFAVLFSTTGISLHKHYSDGEFYSFALYTEAESCCETDCDCCTDEVEFFVLDIDFLNASGPEMNFKETYSENAIFFFVSNNTLFNSEFKDSNNNLTFQNLSPPKYKDIQLVTQVFRC